jgi:glucokinase
MSLNVDYFVGVDVGGTHLRAAVRPAGESRLLAALHAPTLSHEGHAAVLARLAELIRAAVAAAGLTLAQVRAVGLGLPGRLNPAAGVVEFLPNLAGHWIGVRATETLTAALHRPIHLINDARAMTFGEWQYGAGRGVDTLACLTLGTGIGGGVVVNGQLLWGVNGTLGEIGHQVVEADGLPCSCGGRGCLEAYASGTAIAAAGAQAVRAGRDTCLRELAAGDATRLTAAMVAHAAQSGDAVAQAIFARAGLYLGIVISNVALTINPQRVVIGGGMAEVGELILAPARRTLRERVHLAPVDHIEIVPAALGADAGLIGAAGWAEQQERE